VAGTLLTVPLSIATSTPSTSGLPLYQFVDSGAGPLPWNAVSFESSIDGASMLGGPHAASENGENALAFEHRTPTSHCSCRTRAERPVQRSLERSRHSPRGSDPIPFFDPTGAVDVLYVSSSGHLILLSPNYSVAARRHVTARIAAAQPYTSTDLTTLSGVTTTNGLASVNVAGESGLVVVRDSANDIEAISLGWRLNQSVPTIKGSAVNVSNLTNAGASRAIP